MSIYISTVIKTGNSYALRVPKRYIDDAQLTEGQKAAIALPVPTGKQDNAALINALKNLQKASKGWGLAAIEDPVAWQRSIRADKRLPGREY